MTRFWRTWLWAVIGIVAWNVFLFAMFDWLAPGFIPALLEKMP